MTPETGANSALEKDVQSQKQGPGLDCHTAVGGGEENGG
eukprot:CAMPEP_0180396206 /NCGR_PEP_ID=MMETSP0989-20121125/35313_1 /TAXON_ID=697907 /ORGANISM="non described non described, Strain CCMP2293" /LENGTH=38 /DNA_ID= /DNA_START= /DNA_END= /DNA_ORIENTATION=